jgi:purine-nucleoside phosphorylase
MYRKLQDTIAAIRARHAQSPVLGFVLGSGLGSYADGFRGATVIPFESLPYFPRSTTPGHSGNIVLGELDGIPAVALQGRIHYYEGYSMEEVTYPVRVLAGLGIRLLVVTNAAGGINVGFRPGDLMLISDHINLMGVNPLVGKNIEASGLRFPDMSEAYDLRLRNAALAVAQRQGLDLRQGVYAAVTGPSYETPAEIRMFRMLGVDAIGMSTVPEVIVARQMAVRVLGISCITNMAAGILPQTISHQDVIDTAAAVEETFRKFLRALVPELVALESS